MKKNKDEEDILALGERQIEIEIKEEKKKNKALPILLMLLGALLMLVGYFFQDIIDILGIKLTPTTENKQTTIKKNDNELICTSTKEDISLGIKTTIKYIYKFNDKRLLQSLNEKRILKPIENSDIGPDNIKIISGKYNDIVKGFETINGIITSSNLNNDILTVNISYDYKNIDITKIPKNDNIVVTNTLNEESKSVKQKVLNDKDVLCE